MKKLIVYSSKTGTTEKCAGILGQNLIDATIINLATIQNEDINKYDLIIIGSPIRMGMIDKKVKEFLSKNFNILRNKMVCYFICCGFNENWKQYYEQNFPKELLDNTMIYETFGGEMDLEKQKGFDKFIVKMVSKKIDKENEIRLLDENINRFIETINNVIK